MLVLLSLALAVHGGRPIDDCVEDATAWLEHYGNGNQARRHVFVLCPAMCGWVSYRTQRPVDAQEVADTCDQEACTRVGVERLHDGRSMACGIAPVGDVTPWCHTPLVGRVIGGRFETGYSAAEQRAFACEYHGTVLEKWLGPTFASQGCPSKTEESKRQQCGDHRDVFPLRSWPSRLVRKALHGRCL